MKRHSRPVLYGKFVCTLKVAVDTSNNHHSDNNIYECKRTFRRIPEMLSDWVHQGTQKNTNYKDKMYR